MLEEPGGNTRLERGGETKRLIHMHSEAGRHVMKQWRTARRPGPPLHTMMAQIYWYSEAIPHTKKICWHITNKYFLLWNFWGLWKLLYPFKKNKKTKNQKSLSVNLFKHLIYSLCTVINYFWDLQIIEFGRYWYKNKQKKKCCSSRKICSDK